MPVEEDGGWRSHLHIPRTNYQGAVDMSKGKLRAIYPHFKGAARELVLYILITIA